MNRLILCDYGCGREARFCFDNGVNCCSNHHSLCPFVKKKTREALLKSWTPKRKKETSIRTKRQWKETNSLNSEEVKRKRSISLKKVMLNIELRERIKKKNVKYWNHPLVKIEARRRSKANFLDQDYLEKFIKGLNRHPNKQEVKLNKILQKLCPSSYSYVGDFKVWIGGLNPDFIFEGRKKIIEFFGDFWHKKEDVRKRTSIFKEYGYDTLIIWESEFGYVEHIKNKIIEFHER